jgi:hypothetical protein
MQAQGYRLQVAGAAGFERPVVDEVNRDACAFVLRLPVGHYQWRVATLAADPAREGGTRLGPFSTPNPFSVAQALAEPNAPQALEVYWPARAGVRYRAELARDPAFTQVLHGEWLGGHQMSLPLPPRGSYYLRWQIRDAQGRLGRLSATHHIDIATTGLQTSDRQPVRTGGDPPGQEPLTTPSPQGR